MAMAMATIGGRGARALAARAGGRRALGAWARHGGAGVRATARPALGPRAAGLLAAALVGGALAEGRAAHSSGVLADAPVIVPADLDQCDKQFDLRGTNGNLSQCYRRLCELYEEHKEHEARAQLCFRLARASYNLLSSADPVDVEAFGGKEEKKALAEAAVRYAEEAREVAPDDFRSHYWCGIATQAYGDHVGGTKYTLERLMDIRSSFEKAAELNPEDGTTLYCLGSWCFSLSDLGWVSRKLASTLFATPPTSSFEEALEFFLKAEEVEPGFWNKNSLMVAKTYEKLGRAAEAAKWAKEVIARPSLGPEDAAVSKEAGEILKRNEGK